MRVCVYDGWERQRGCVCVCVCVCVFVCVCVHLLMFVLLHNVYNACLCVYVLCQQVVLGGGQEAREVTTTTTKAGKFDT